MRVSNRITLPSEVVREDLDDAGGVLPGHAWERKLQLFY